MYQEVQLYLGSLADKQRRAGQLAGSGEAEEPIDPPEVYLMMRQCRYPTHFPLAGGWMDQPWLLIQQFEICLRAREDFEKAQQVLAAVADKAKKNLPM